MLSDEVEVWPTDGAGSFCFAPPGAERTSTIGREKATNPLLQAGDEETFVRRLTSSLGGFPPYFLRLAEANRLGPALIERPRLQPLSAARVRAVAALTAASGLLVAARMYETHPKERR